MKVGTDAMILGALIDSQGKSSCLDIGTGTGVLSMMVAQRNSEIKVLAIEIDEASAEEATVNFQNSSFSDRLAVVKQDFRVLDFTDRFDLIISNPPYFENGLLNESSRKAKTRHEESLPLIELFEKASSLLSQNGHFWLILPYETAGKWIATAMDTGLFCEQEIAIFGKPNLPKRMVLCFSNVENSHLKKSIVIRNEDNTYTDEYKNLTEDFHGIKI